MKVLLLTDKPNWAYHSIAKSLCKYNADKDVSIKVMHIKKNVDAIRKQYSKYDRYLVMGWQTYGLVNFLPKKNTLIGIHSHHSWDKRKTKPEKNIAPPKDLVKLLNSFKAVNAVSNKLYRLFRKAGVKSIYYTPNGADSNVFKSNTEKSDKQFYVGYSGSKSHDWRKGVSKYIIPATKKAGVKIKIAMLSTGNYVPLEEMPSFYGDLHAYVCASSSEGFSLSVLEAASCGVPIITTRVGGMKELIDDGRNGFLVDRDVGSIVEKISLLKNDRSLLASMSKNMRKSIVDKWCWSKRTKDWIDFLKI